MSAKRIKRKSKQTARYIPLDDIKTIDDVFLNEINNVRMKLSGCDDEKLINAFNEVLVNGYKAAIELKALEREVDYDIKFAEIKAREDELKPVRHRRVWWLLFRRLTNRAQDIIEERAELDAHVIHTAAEKQIDEDWKRLFPDSEVKLSKREIKRLVREKLKAVIEQADKMETNEVLNAPENVQNVAENVEKQEAKQTDKPAELKPANVQKPVQNAESLAPVQAQPQTVLARRPRPPRSCRKQ